MPLLASLVAYSFLSQFFLINSYLVPYFTSIKHFSKYEVPQFSTLNKNVIVHLLRMLTKVNLIQIMLELLHTHLGFIFLKVVPCLLVIISHYPISYNLGENIPPGDYFLSVDTSV
jgi:hypothetical protein